MIYQRLNLPVIDIDSKTIHLGQQVQTSDNGLSSKVVADEDTLKKIKQCLPEYILNVLDDEYDYTILTFGPASNGIIHRDGRIFCINYTLDPGGSDVHTRIYNDNLDEIASYVQQKHTWTMLRTQMNHTVTGIEYQRIQLSISFGGYPKFNNRLTEELLEKFIAEYGIS